MKKYKYTGISSTAFTIKNEDNSNRDIIISNNTEVSLPEDQDIVKDMVEKKLLIEVVETKDDSKKSDPKKDEKNK